MSPVSSQSLSSALRRAFPCLPRLLLQGGDLVVCGKEELAEVVADSAVLEGNEKRPPGAIAPPFAPLTTRPFYRSTTETWNTVFNFNEKHGYTSSLFLQSNLTTPSSQILIGGRDISASLLNESNDAFGGRAVSVSTPVVTVPLLRCEQRLNLTDCMRTRALQEELQRTEEEIRVLYQSARSPSVHASNNEETSSRAPSHMWKAAAEITDRLQLVWDGRGWCVEDSAMATEESKWISHAGVSTGYWCAWLKPFKKPLIDPLLFCVQNILQFQAEVHVTFINAEARYIHSLSGHHVASLRRCVRGTNDYWASTGELVQLQDSVGEVPLAEENNDDKTSHSGRFLRDRCWFTVAELPKHQLQVRSDGKVFQLPVRYDDCGFFLHEAPQWFLCSWEELLQVHPLLPATVKKTSFTSGLGAAVDAMTSAAHTEQFHKEFVFVLRHTGEWHAFPRQHTHLNICNGATHMNNMQCPQVTLPLLFIGINAAVQLMRTWSKCHQQDKSAETSGETEEQLQQRRLIDFFAQLQSTTSAVTLIHDIIAHCASPVRCPLPTKEDGMVTPTCCEHAPAVPDTKYRENQKGLQNRKKPLQPLLITQSDEDYEKDFPALDSSVYTSSHRISLAYTHPRDEQMKRDFPKTFTSSTSGLAKELIKAKKQKSRITPKLQPMHLFFTSQTHAYKSSFATIWDLGVLSLSFTCTVSAVEAADTETKA